MAPRLPAPRDSRAGLVRRKPRFDADDDAIDLSSGAYTRISAEDPGSLVEYLRILNRRKGTLLLIALVGTLAGFLLTRAQSPKYRARALVEIENLNDDFLNMRKVMPTATDENMQSPEYNIRTQMAVLQSRPVLERMLQKDNLEKRLLSKQQRRNFPWSRKGVAPVHESPLVLRDRAIAMAGAGLRVRAQPNTRIVEITFDSTDPQIAADLANSLTSAFTEVSLENRWRSIQNTSEWLTRQVQDVKAKLEKSEDALQRYAHASDLTFLSGSANTTTSEERLKELQIELSKAEADRVEKQSRFEQAKNAPADSLPEVVDNDTLKHYQVELTALRRQLADLSSSYTSTYPKVVSVQSQITALEAARDKERANVIVRMRNEYEAAVRREKLVKNDYDAVIALMAQEADKINHYSLLKREVDTTRQLYDSMIQRVKEANLASAMNATDIHVIESARPPGRPYKPITLLNLSFGGFSGLCVAVAFVIYRARSHSGIQNPGDSVPELNVPELGVIPAANFTKSTRMSGLLGDAGRRTSGGAELSTSKQTTSVLAESFRLTLASILLSSDNSILTRVIAVSSANAGEGKTTVACNLGIALAQINHPTLLVDGDLRRPRLHRVFGVDNTEGLYEALSGGALPSIKETHIPNLSVLPSGKSTSGEMLFFTSKVRELLKKLKTQFDIILIDTPPLLQVADARLMCSQVDGTVLVIAQHTPREHALLARQQLADDGSEVLGTILNKWDPKTSTRGCGNYPNYYKDYYA